MTRLEPPLITRIVVVVVVVAVVINVVVVVELAITRVTRNQPQIMWFVQGGLEQLRDFFGWFCVTLVTTSSTINDLQTVAAATSQQLQQLEQHRLKTCRVELLVFYFIFLSFFDYNNVFILGWFNTSNGTATPAWARDMDKRCSRGGVHWIGMNRGSRHNASWAAGTFFISFYFSYFLNGCFFTDTYTTLTPTPHPNGAQDTTCLEPHILFWLQIIFT